MKKRKNLIESNYKYVKPAKDISKVEFIVLIIFILIRVIRDF